MRCKSVFAFLRAFERACMLEGGLQRPSRLKVPMHRPDVHVLPCGAVVTDGGSNHLAIILGVLLGVLACLSLIAIIVAVVVVRRRRNRRDDDSESGRSSSQASLRTGLCISRSIVLLSFGCIWGLPSAAGYVVQALAPSLMLPSLVSDACHAHQAVFPRPVAANLQPGM